MLLSSPQWAGSHSLTLISCFTLLTYHKRIDLRSVQVNNDQRLQVVKILRDCTTGTRSRHHPQGPPFRSFLSSASCNVTPGRLTTQAQSSQNAGNRNRSSTQICVLIVLFLLTDRSTFSCSLATDLHVLEHVRYMAEDKRVVGPA